MASIRYQAYDRNGEKFQFSAPSTTSAIDYCRRNGYNFIGVVQSYIGFVIDHRP